MVVQPKVLPGLRENIGIAIEYFASIVAQIYPDSQGTESITEVDRLVRHWMNKEKQIADIEYFEQRKESNL